MPVTGLFSAIVGSKPKKIEIVSRATGETFEEKVYAEDMMRLAYGTAGGAAITTKVLVNRWLSNVYGAYNDSGASKHKIEEFAKALNIDLSECDKDISEYHSFNDFFARKLKPAARPIAEDPLAVCSPGDGRLLVFPKVTDGTISYVKWAPVKLFELFNRNHVLAERYNNGSCGVLRICPSDYHRFHFPVAGKAGVTKTVPGLLHSVNPYALEQKIPVFCMNKRTLCSLETEKFGRVLLMEVGALFVGSIVQTYRTGTAVQKGEEKGFFKFGGSTTIFFFEKGAMEFDKDLLTNSEKGFESFVKMGERIGLRG